MKHNDILIIACGALANEIIAIKNINNIDNIDLKCLPANLHNRPEKIPPQLKEKIEKYKLIYRKIFVAYGDCGTGGAIDELLQKYDIQRIDGVHCYSFFSGNDNFKEKTEKEFDAFYLTDFLARHFETIIWKGLGIKKHPELLECYFHNYRKIVYLAQTDDKYLQECAKNAAKKLKLKYEYRFTGYGELQDFITNKISSLEK